VRHLVNHPLTWMIVAVGVVMAALLLIAWNLIAVAAVHHMSAAVTAAEAAPSTAAAKPPALRVVDSPVARGPLPGLNVDSAFWRSRLGALNHDQMIFERLERHVVQVAKDAAQSYLETVLLPSVTRAEHAHAGAAQA